MYFKIYHWVQANRPLGKSPASTDSAKVRFRFMKNRVHFLEKLPKNLYFTEGGRAGGGGEE